MKGLMVKDLRLLFSQKKTWLMYIMLCLMMSFSMQGAFIVGYTVMLAGVIGISTISYDQADNGMPFLLTLPTDRKGYVREKYLLCLLMEACGAAVGIILCEVTSLVKNGSGVPADDIRSAVVVIPVMLILVSFMAPINLKYGAEKARLVMMIAYGIIGAITASAVVLMQDIMPDLGHSALVKIKVFFDETLGGTYFWTVPVVLTVLSLAVMYVSYRISVRIVSNKEY
ncbi:MAG: ABC-2 transporter permease [Oscillospiraceae bacterium]|nr:ABC-2 transporter permease [Oscillospiraceae bacterium]